MVGLRGSQCQQVTLCVLVTILFSVQQIPSAESAEILFYVGFGGPSHRIAMQPLADRLASGGHNVTFLVLEKPKHSDTSNIRYFVPKKLSETFADRISNVNFYEMRASGRTTFAFLFMQSFGAIVCESLLTDADALQWIKSTKFDLVIIDGLLNDCGYAIAHLHEAKTILFSISTILPWQSDAFGIPDETSSIPDIMIGHDQMNFFHRTINAILPVYWRLFREWIYFPRLDKITRESLGNPNFPRYSELERNTSLFLVNTHVTQEYPRALPSNVIPVGGISWVEKKKPIPKKMEDFINEGKEGFMYISFGSWIDFLTFPEDVQQTFIRTLNHFPQLRFIWKLNKVPDNLPSNVLIEKWLPQQDLLRHPKIKAFITHSGIGGINEAIYSSVPLICFPILSEQEYNAYLVESKGLGLKLEITALTENDLKSAIQEILRNNLYRVNIKKTSERFLDRVTTPLETANWWVEYVLRHEDTEFLRSRSIAQPWWVKRQIDVWIFVLIVLTTVSIGSLYVILKLFKKCFMGANKTKKQKQQ